MPLLTLHDPITAKRFHEQGLWREEGLFDHAARQAQAIPNHYAVRDSKRRLTWRQLEKWSQAIANTFADRGLVIGDRVAMALSNRVEAIAVMLACSRNGYICNPSLHRNYRASEMVSLIDEINAAAVVAEKGWSADGIDLVELLKERDSRCFCFSNDNIFPELLDRC